MPSAADEVRFWSLVESAWQLAGDDAAALRAGLTSDGDNAYAIEDHLDAFLDHLRAAGTELSDAELIDLDRVVERKLYDLDRADIQAITDGSDDGFLYCRGFIVAMGQRFYDAVLADPEVAVADAECGTLPYFFASLYADRHDGTFPDTGSGISRETASNKAGWAV